MSVASKSVKMKEKQGATVDMAHPPRVVAVIRPTLKSEASLPKVPTSAEAEGLDDIVRFPKDVSGVMLSAGLGPQDETPSEKGLVLFGPSGSGKTWLAKRLFKAILERLLAQYTSPIYRVSVSAFEFGITGNVHDLCDAKTPGVPTMKTLGASVKTTTEVTIKKADRIDEEWRKIQALRSTGSTSNNATSSRRHAVYTMHVYATTPGSSKAAAQATGLFTVIKLFDLAGAEKTADIIQSDLKTQSAQIKESRAIVDSLDKIMKIPALLTTPAGIIETEKLSRSSHLCRTIAEVLQYKSPTVLICALTSLQKDEGRCKDTIAFGLAFKDIRQTIAIQRAALICQTTLSHVASNRPALPVPDMQRPDPELFRLQSMVKDQTSQYTEAAEKLKQAEQELFEARRQMVEQEVSNEKELASAKTDFESRLKEAESLGVETIEILEAEVQSLKLQAEVTKTAQDKAATVANQHAAQSAKRIEMLEKQINDSKRKRDASPQGSTEAASAKRPRTSQGKSTEGEASAVDTGLKRHLKDFIFSWEQ